MLPHLWTAPVECVVEGPKSGGVCITTDRWAYVVIMCYVLPAQRLCRLDLQSVYHQHHFKVNGGRRIWLLLSKVAKELQSNFVVIASSSRCPHFVVIPPSSRRRQHAAIVLLSSRRYQFYRRHTVIVVVFRLSCRLLKDLHSKMCSHQRTPLRASAVQFGEIYSVHLFLCMKKLSLSFAILFYYFCTFLWRHTFYMATAASVVCALI